MSFKIVSFLTSLFSAATLTPSDNVSWFGNWFGNLWVALGQGICSLFYGVCKWFLAFVDFLQYFIQKLIGLDYWLNNNVYTLKGATDNDLLFSFLYNESVQRVFTAMVAIFFVLLIVFTIFAIVKSEWKFITQGEKDNSKTKILRSSLKAIVLVLIFPIMLVMGIISSNAILASLVKALNIDMSTTFGATLFQISSQSAIKYREYAKGGQRSAVSNKVTFYISGSGKSAKQIVLSTGISGTEGNTIHCATYADYAAAIASAKKYSVNSMFEPINPSTEHSFTGYAIRLNKKNYLVKAEGESSNGYPMYYYLKCVLGAEVLNKDESYTETDLHNDLKGYMENNVYGYIATGIDLEEFGSQNNATIQAAYNTWSYSSIYTQKYSFETCQSYDILYGDEDSYLKTTLGITSVSNAKLMYNDDLISSYFDGGQFGIVQKQAEYYVMADVIEFIQKNDITLYMMDITSDMITWDYSDNNYQVDTKWVATADSGLSAGLKKTEIAGEDHVAFIVSYSEECNDVDYGNVLYLAKSGKNNEREGSVFIMCLKVTINNSETFIPLINGKTFIDPLTKNTYNFKSSYFESNYRGLVIAKGAFDTSSTNKEIGEPTYLQSSYSVKNQTGALWWKDEEIVSISATTPYYYDIIPNGGLDQYGEMATGGVAEGAKQGYTEKFEVSKFDISYNGNKYKIIENCNNDEIYYQIADSNGNVISDIADIQATDTGFIDDLMQNVKFKAKLAGTTGTDYNLELTYQKLNKSTNNERYYWYATTDGLGCYVVLNISANTITFETYDGTAFVVSSDGSKNTCILQKPVKYIFNEATLEEGHYFVVGEDTYKISQNSDGSYVLNRKYNDSWEQLDNIYSILAHNETKYTSLLNSVTNNFQFTLKIADDTENKVYEAGPNGVIESSDEDGKVFVRTFTAEDGSGNVILKISLKYKENSIVLYSEDDNQLALSSIISSEYVNNTNYNLLQLSNQNNFVIERIDNESGNASIVADLSYMFDSSYDGTFYSTYLPEFLTTNQLISYKLFNGSEFEDWIAVDSSSLNYIADRRENENGESTVVYNVVSGSDIIFSIDFLEGQNLMTLHSFVIVDENENETIHKSFTATNTSVDVYQKSKDSTLTLSMNAIEIYNGSAYKDSAEYSYERFVTGFTDTSHQNKYVLIQTIVEEEAEPADGEEEVVNIIYSFSFYKKIDASTFEFLTNITSMKAVDENYVTAIGDSLKLSITNVVGTTKQSENLQPVEDSYNASNYKVIFDASEKSYVYIDFNFATNKMVLYKTYTGGSLENKITSYISVVHPDAITNNSNENYVYEYFVTNVQFASSDWSGSGYSIVQAQNALGETLNKYYIKNSAGNVDNIKNGMVSDLRISLEYLSDGRLISDSATYVGVSYGDNGTAHGVTYVYRTDLGYYFGVKGFVTNSSTDRLSDYISIISMNYDGTFGETYDVRKVEVGTEEVYKNVIQAYTKKYVLKYDYSNNENSTSNVTGEVINTLTPQYLEFAYYDNVVYDGKSTQYSVFKTVSAEPLNSLDMYKKIYVFMNTTSKDVVYVDGNTLSFHNLISKSYGGCYKSYFLKFKLYNYYAGYSTSDGVIYEYDNKNKKATNDITELDLELNCKVNVNSFNWIAESNSYGLYDGNEYVATIYKNYGEAITDVGMLASNTVSILYHDTEANTLNTYYNIRKQNAHANKDAIETHYQTLRNSFVTACLRDNFTTEFGRWDFNFWKLSKIRFKLALCTFSVTEASMGGGIDGDASLSANMSHTFYLSDGVNFDYFFDDNNGIDLATFFVPGKIAYWIILISSALIIKVLMTSVWGVIKRFYEITLYYIAMPAMASTIVLDDGARFKKAIQDPLIAKVLGTYGVILGINVFFILLAPVKSLSQVFTAEDIATSGSYFLIKLGFSADVLNNYVYILFVLVAFTMIEALPKIISTMLDTDKAGGDIFKSGEDTKKKVGTSLKTATDTITGKSVVDTVAGGAKGALGAVTGGVAALPFKAAKGIKNKLSGAKEGENAANQDIENNGGTTGTGTESQKIDDETEGEVDETTTTNNGQPGGPGGTGDPITQVENAVQNVTGVDPTTVGQTGDAVTQAVTQAATAEVSEGLETEGEREAYAQQQFNDNAVENSSIVGGSATQAIANTIKNNASSGAGATAVAAAINNNTTENHGLTKDQVMALIMSAIASLDDNDDTKKQYLDANGNIDPSKIDPSKFNITAGTDANGNMQFAVTGEDGSVVGNADAETSAKVATEAANAIGGEDLVIAAQQTGTYGNISSILGQNIIAGLNFDEEADPTTVVDGMTEQIFAAAAENEDVKADAVLRELIATGGIKQLLDTYRLTGPDGQAIDPEMIFGKGNEANYAAVTDLIKSLSKSTDSNIVTDVLDDPNALNKHLAKSIKSSGFTMTAWELQQRVDPEGVAEFQNQVVAERAALRGHTIMEGATVAEQNAILANTATNVMASDPNGAIAKSIQYAAFIQSLQGLDLSKIDPDTLKALTGKTSVDALTEDDKAKLGFAASTGIDLTQKMSELDAGLVSGHFANAEDRMKAFNSITGGDEAKIADIVKLSGNDGLLAKAATIDSSLAVNKDELANLELANLDTLDEKIKNLILQLINANKKPGEQLTDISQIKADDIKNNPQVANLIMASMQQNGFDFATHVNANYVKHNARTEAEQEFEHKRSIETILAESPDSLYHAFTNSDVENKSIITSDMLALFTGVDKNNTAAITKAVEGLGLDPAALAKMRSEGRSDEDILMAYKTAQLLGKVDKDGKVIGGGDLNAVVDGFIKMGDDEEQRANLDKMILNGMESMDQTAQLELFGKGKSFDNVKKALVETQLTPDQRRDLAEDVASQGLAGFSEADQNKILAQMADQDGEVKDAYNEWLKNNPGGDMTAFLNSQEGADYKERLQIRAGDKSYYELSEIAKGRSAQDVYDEIHAEVSKQVYIDNKTAAEAQYITAENVQEQLQVEGSGEGTSVFASAVADKVDLLSEEEKAKIKRKAVIDKLIAEGKLKAEDADNAAVVDKAIEDYIAEGGVNAKMLLEDAGDTAVANENRMRIALGFGERQRMMADIVREDKGLMRKAREEYVREHPGVDLDNVDILEQTQFLAEFAEKHAGKKQKAKVDSAYLEKLGITDDIIKSKKIAGVSSVEDFIDYAKKNGQSIDEALRTSGLKGDIKPDEVDSAIVAGLSSDEFAATYAAVEKENPDAIMAIKRNFVARKLDEQTDLGLDEYANSKLSAAEKEALLFDKLFESEGVVDATTGKTITYADLSDTEKQELTKGKKIEDMSDAEILANMNAVLAKRGNKIKRVASVVEAAVTDDTVLNGLKSGSVDNNFMSSFGGMTNVAFQKQMAKMYKAETGKDFSSLSKQEQYFYAMQNIDAITSKLGKKDRESVRNSYVQAIIGGPNANFKKLGAKTSDGRDIISTNDLISYAEKNGMSLNEALLSLNVNDNKAPHLNRLKKLDQYNKAVGIRKQIKEESDAQYREEVMSDTATVSMLDTIKGNKAFLRRVARQYKKDTGKKFDINDIESIEYLRNDDNFNKIYNSDKFYSGGSKKKVNKVNDAMSLYGDSDLASKIEGNSALNSVAKKKYKEAKKHNKNLTFEQFVNDTNNHDEIFGSLIKGNKAYLKAAKKAFKADPNNKGKKFDLSDAATMSFLLEKDANGNFVRLGDIYNGASAEIATKKKKDSLRMFDSAYVKNALGIRNNQDFAALGIDNGKGGTFTNINDFIQDAAKKGLTIKQALAAATVNGGQKFTSKHLDRLKNLRVARSGVASSYGEIDALFDIARKDKKAMDYVNKKFAKENNGKKLSDLTLLEKKKYITDNYNNYLNGVGVTGVFKGKRVKRANEKYIEQLLGKNKNLEEFGIRDSKGKAYKNAAQLIKAAKKKGISVEELILSSAADNEQNQQILQSRLIAGTFTRKTAADQQQRIRELAGGASTNITAIRGSVYREHFKRNRTGVTQAITGDSTQPDLTKMTETERRNFNFNKNLLQSRLRNNGNTEILSNIFKNTRLLNEDNIVAEMAMLQTGKNSFNLDAKMEILKNNPEFIAKVVSAAGGKTSGPIFEAELKKAAETATIDDVKKGLTSDTVNKYLSSHESTKDQLLNLGANNLMLTLNKNAQNEKNLQAAMQSTSTQNQVARDLLKNEFGNSSDIKRMIRDMLNSESEEFRGKSNADKDKYITDHYETLMTKLARNRYLTTDAAGNVSINKNTTDVNNVFNTVNHLMANDKGFKKTVYTNATKAVSPTSRATEREKDEFFKSAEIMEDSVVDKSAGKGVKKKYGDIDDMFKHFTKDGFFTGLKNRAGYIFSFGKKLPEVSAAYDNWNRVLENKIRDIKAGTGDYASMTIAQRKVEVEKLQAQKIISRKVANYDAMSTEEQMAFDKQQLLLKKEAMSTGNFSKAYKKGLKKTNSTKKALNEYGKELGYQVTRSETTRLRHRQELTDISSKITRYNASAPMRNKELEFGSRFSNFAQSYLSPKQYQDMMKKFGLKSDAEYAKLNDKAKAAERQLREDAMAKYMNNMYRVASKKVARDNKVKPRTFLEERGIETINVRYRDGSKKFREVKSTTATSIKNQKKGKFKKNSLEADVQARNERIRLDTISRNLTGFKFGPNMDMDELKKILGPYGEKWFKKGHIKKTTPHSVIERTMWKFWEEENKKNKYRQQNPNSPVPAAASTRGNYTGQTFTNKKSKHDVSVDRSRAEGYNRMLKLVTSQKGLVTYEGLLGRLESHVRADISKELAKKTAKVTSDVKKKEILESILRARLQEANRKVHNKTLLANDTAKLKKLNGVYVNKAELHKGKVSGTMMSGLDTTSSGIYQNLVKHFNSANSRYKAEQMNLDQLISRLNAVKAGPQTRATKGQINQLISAIAASRTRLATLKSLVQTAESRKVTFEKQFATKQIQTAKVTTKNVGYNTSGSVHSSYNFYKVGQNAPIAQHSLEGRQVDKIVEKFVKGNKYMLQYMAKKFADKDKELHDYISKVSKNLTDDLTKNISTVKSTISKLKAKLTSVQRDSKTKDVALETELKDNLTKLKKLDADLVEQLRAMGIQLSKVERKK